MRRRSMGFLLMALFLVAAPALPAARLSAAQDGPPGSFYTGGGPGRLQGRLDYDPSPQSQSLLYDEARAVYLGNLARRQNGAPPLRWNLQMTHAARWFSWDSTENRPGGFCGHQDTLGGWPGDRAFTFGYRGSAGAENAFCGYVTPEDAIKGWMNSPGHRANLLDPNSREIGLGYYRRASDGRGYVTQDFGNDPVYPPVVIDNEALSTPSLQTQLYIYDSSGPGGFTARGPATQMQVSNDECFTAAAWESYAAEKPWTLAPGGDGWRQVYVRTRDALNRTSSASDTIYFGPELPVAELGAPQMSTTQSSVTLYGLDGGGLPQAQFSLGWAADDTFDTFSLLWGTGERVNDGAAWGGTAYRLGPPANAAESSAWVWTTEFPRNTPLVAYVRLKVASNTSQGEVARFAVTGGSTLSLKGTDFRAAGAYQEFPTAFTFPDAETFFILQFWRSGATDVYVDAVTIFTAPQPFGATTSWPAPGGNYRGQGVWVRYTDGGGRFSGITEAVTAGPRLSAAPGALEFVAQRGGQPPPGRTLHVASHCLSGGWQVTADAAWLQASAGGDTATVRVNQAGLGSGTYRGTVTLAAAGAAPVATPVTLRVVEQVYAGYAPLIGR